MADLAAVHIGGKPCDDPPAGRYIIQFNDKESHEDAKKRIGGNEIDGLHGGDFIHNFVGFGNFFSLNAGLTKDQLTLVRGLPGVKMIEADAEVHAMGI